MSRKSFDKRLAFIKQTLIQKITDEPTLANHWYINNGGAKLDNGEALRRFKAWLGRDSEPDLGQMFDMAYEDQCRDACGL